MNRRWLEKIKLIWHWETADPELEYNGVVANYYTIEDTLYEQWKEDMDEEVYKVLNEKQRDFIFNQWLKNNIHLVEEAFEVYKNFNS